MFKSGRVTMDALHTREAVHRLQAGGRSRGDLGSDCQPGLKSGRPRAISIGVAHKMPRSTTSTPQKRRAVHSGFSLSATRRPTVDGQAPLLSAAHLLASCLAITARPWPWVMSRSPAVTHLEF